MRIGVMFNIPIHIHWSWLIGFVVLTWLIASAGLPFISINLTETQEWIIAGIVTLALFVSVLAHELAHSLTAKRLGYSVSSITLMIFGGVSIIAENRSRASHDFLIAFAGPAMSLAIGIVAFALFLVYRNPTFTGGAAMLEGILFYVGLQNVALAVFNMLPGLPLDGGRVLQSAVWALTGNRGFATRFAGRAGQALSLLLLVAAAYLIVAQGNLSSGLWLVLIALFIMSGSSAETRHARRRQRKESDFRISVRAVMSYAPTALNASTPLDAAVRNVISLHHDTAIPVISEGLVTAVISLKHVTDLGLSPGEGAGLTVSDAAHPVSAMVIGADSDISLARSMLEKRSVDLLLVFEDDRLVGTIGVSDFERAAANLDPSYRTP